MMTPGFNPGLPLTRLKVLASFRNIAVLTNKLFFTIKSNLPFQIFSGCFSAPPVRHEACVYINLKPMWMKEPHNPICRSG
jgi:hypothetical protein